MLKRFAEYSEALKAGRELCEKMNCRFYVQTVYIPSGKSVAFLAGPSSFHLLPGRGGNISPGFGWHFGGIGVMADSPEGVALLAQADREPLPGQQERWYELAACYTQGFTHEERLEIARGMDRGDTCVWHETARVKGQLTRCQCATCEKARKAP